MLEDERPLAEPEIVGSGCTDCPDLIESVEMNETNELEAALALEMPWASGGAVDELDLDEALFAEGFEEGEDEFLSELDELSEAGDELALDDLGWLGTEESLAMGEVELEAVELEDDLLAEEDLELAVGEIEGGGPTLADLADFARAHPGLKITISY